MSTCESKEVQRQRARQQAQVRRASRPSRPADSTPSATSADDAATGERAPESEAPATDEGLVHANPSSEEEQQLALGREAQEQLLRNADDAWASAMTYARAVALVQTLAMGLAHTNKPLGKRYARACAELLRRFGLDKIHKSDRSRLVKGLEHEAAIAEWRAGLSEDERSRITSPIVVIRKWLATQKPKADKPKKQTRKELEEELAAAQERNFQLECKLAHNDKSDDRALAYNAIQQWGDRAEYVARAVLELVAEPEPVGAGANS